MAEKIRKGLAWLVAQGNIICEWMLALGIGGLCATAVLCRTMFRREELRAALLTAKQVQVDDYTVSMFGISVLLLLFVLLAAKKIPISAKLLPFCVMAYLLFFPLMLYDEQFTVAFETITWGLWTNVVRAVIDCVKICRKRRCENVSFVTFFHRS